MQRTGDSLPLECTYFPLFFVCFHLSHSFLFPFFVFLILVRYSVCVVFPSLSCFVNSFFLLFLCSVFLEFVCAVFILIYFLLFFKIPLLNSLLHLHSLASCDYIQSLEYK